MCPRWMFPLAARVEAQGKPAVSPSHRVQRGTTATLLAISAATHAEGTIRVAVFWEDANAGCDVTGARAAETPKWRVYVCVFAISNERTSSTPKLYSVWHQSHSISSG